VQFLSALPVLLAFPVLLVCLPICRFVYLVGLPLLMSFCLVVCLCWRSACPVGLPVLSVCISCHLSVLSSAYLGSELVLSVCLSCRYACPVGTPLLSVFLLYCTTTKVPLLCQMYVPYICRKRLLIYGLYTGKYENTKKCAFTYVSTYSCTLLQTADTAGKRCIFHNKDKQKQKGCCLEFKLKGGRYILIVHIE
jgi:hypothetical protein